MRRILPNPDNDCEVYIVIEKDSPIQKNIVLELERQFKGKDIIITMIELKRKKGKK